MGRIYYATPKHSEDERIVHILTTDHGTVVLAMRAPRAGERGFAVGVDFTVRNAVKEMLADWGPSDPGPGWVANESVGERYRPRPGDEIFEVTILAAFERKYTDTDRGDATERVFDIVRNWPARGPEDDEIEDVVAMASACVDTVLDGHTEVKP